MGRARARGPARGGSGARAARAGSPPRRAALVLPSGAGVRPGPDRSAVPAAGRGVAAGMRRSGRLIALLLLSACQPQARRLLLLDLALSEPALLNSTVQPWRDEGYAVEYRRFYPHLARADLGRYRVLLFLLGREPEAPSDALTAGDLALLTEWVLRSGGDPDRRRARGRHQPPRARRAGAPVPAHDGSRAAARRPGADGRIPPRARPLDPPPGRVGARPARRTWRAARPGAGARTCRARGPRDDSPAGRRHDHAAARSGSEARPRHQHPRVAAAAGHAGALDAVVRDP